MKQIILVPIAAQQPQGKFGGILHGNLYLVIIIIALIALYSRK